MATTAVSAAVSTAARRSFALLAAALLSPALFAAQLTLRSVSTLPGGSSEIAIELRDSRPLRMIEADVYFPRDVSFCFITPSNPAYHLSAVPTPGGVHLTFDATPATPLYAGVLAQMTVAVSSAATASEELIVLERATAFDGEANELQLRPVASAIEILATAPGRRRAVLPPVAERPQTSYEKIENARKSGKIDSETAILYTVYADFGDSRLPLDYRGAQSIVTEGIGLVEAQENFDSLSAAAQQILVPFLTPAFYKGSWWDLAHQQKGTAATKPYAAPIGPTCEEINPFWSAVGDDKVRVWYTTDNGGNAATAGRLYDEIKNNIWGKLTAYMGRVPLPDGGSTQKCRGGTDALDIILVDRVTTGDTIPFNHGNCTGEGPEAAYVLLNPDGPQDILRVAAHEFMHVLEYQSFTHGVCMRHLDEYRWLLEGIAEWSIDYVYGRNRPASGKQDEHISEGYFLADYGNDYRPGLPLDYKEPGGAKNTSHGYGTWLLPFFLAKKYGDDGFARRVLSVIPTQSDLGAVVNSVGNGGFENVWPEFVKSNWNQKPVDDLQTWDDIDMRKDIQGAEFPGAYPIKDFRPRKVTGSDTEIKLKDSEFEHLSAKYYQFKFEDDTVRTVSFWNGLGFNVKQEQGLYFTSMDATYFKGVDVSDDQKKGLFVRALFKVDGSDDWTIEDWSKMPYRTFCRDEKSDRLTDLVIIISNSDTDKNRTLKAAGFPPRLMLSTLGCYRYEGTMSMEITEPPSFRFFATGTITWNRSGDLKQYAMSPPGVAPGVVFNSSGSPLPVMISGTDSAGCAHSGSGTFLASGGTLTTGNYLLPGTRLENTYFGLSRSAVVVTDTVSGGEDCMPASGFGFGAGGFWFAPLHTPDTDDPFKTWKALQDGTLKDRLVLKGDRGSQATYTWELKPKRE